MLNCPIDITSQAPRTGSDHYKWVDVAFSRFDVDVFSSYNFDVDFFKIFFRFDV